MGYPDHHHGRPALGAVLGACVAAGLIASGCRKTSAPPRGGETRRPKTLVTPSGIEMVLLPAGEFLMGDDAGEDDERPARRGRVGAFLIDRTEVTQKAYQALTGRNPSKFKDPNRPVERLSWVSAVKFCNLRSLREGLEPCYDPRTLACRFDANGYRLPTEAEWEYACRAGTTTRYGFGADPAGLRGCAWYKANAGGRTHAVAGRKPNAWGLYDMHGNVAEWCQDFYDEAYYASAPAADRRGPASGEDRVLRGGSWRSAADACRSAARSSEEPAFVDACFGSEAYGFRCVRRAP